MLKRRPATDAKGPVGGREGLAHQPAPPKGTLHGRIRHEGRMTKRRFVTSWDEDGLSNHIGLTTNKRTFMINYMHNPRRCSKFKLVILAHGVGKLAT